MVDPAASNGDTLVDPALIVYPIHVDYEEEWWQHIPLWESNTHGGRTTTIKLGHHEHKPLTSKQEYNNFMASNRRLSTAYFCNTLQSFLRGIWSYAFSKSKKTCVGVLAYCQDFSKFLVSENLVCSATAGTKTALGILQIWFNYFATYFSRHLICNFPRRRRRVMPRYLVHSLLYLPSCVWGWSPSLPIFWCPRRTPARLTHTSQPKNPSRF